MPAKQGLYRTFSKGFTLIEVIVVMAIFSIVVMAIFSLVIPTQQSTVAQTRLSDLQQGMRLALNVMTQDILKAGFLVLEDPITFPGGTGMANADPVDFTIRTRIVGNNFGRVEADAGTTGVLPLGLDSMSQNFKIGSKVCLYEPLQTNALTTNPATVTAVTDDPAVVGDATITINNTAVSVGVETIVVEVQNLTDCPTGAQAQTIRYRVNNGALERIINGTPQILARNIAGATFTYEWTSASSPPRKVRRIDILLRGQTQALKDDLISGAKDRDARTSVTLRNVF